MSKLTDAERLEIAPEIEKLQAEKPDPDETPLNEIERIFSTLRQKYQGKEFCFAATLNREGTYDYYVDDVKQPKADKVPK